MSTPRFLRSVIELALCDSLDELLDTALGVVTRELGVTGCIQLVDIDGVRRIRGAVGRDRSVHRTLIGTRYTIGAILLDAAPADAADIELLAVQLAPLADRLLMSEGSERRTIREEVERVCERRIRESLARSNWNASSVARELSVSRGRIGRLVRRWRPR